MPYECVRCYSNMLGGDMDAAGDGSIMLGCQRDGLETTWMWLDIIVTCGDVIGVC